MNTSTNRPLVAAGWTVHLVVNEKTALRPSSISAKSATSFMAQYDAQLRPGTPLAIVWQDGRPNPAPSVATCWMQQGSSGTSTIVGSAPLVPGQQVYASIKRVVVTGALPLKPMLVIRDGRTPDSQTPLASFTLLCGPQQPGPLPATSSTAVPAPPQTAVQPNTPITTPERTVSGALYSPQTEQRAYRNLQNSYHEALGKADYFEKTVATLYRYLPPAAHLRYLDSRLTEDALAPALRASIAETRQHVVEQLRRESSAAVQDEFFGLLSALEEGNAVPDVNSSFDRSS
ncbi:hypothetical protein JCM10908_001590 [Rhodotorula pacifica]|uniref:uncharacterized protein n=1 Tax=Rhodotorula pacifica TaxID=1495444 RepID=UPI00316EC6AD